MGFNRKYQKEFIDGDNLSASDLEQNLVELHLINTRLGGYKTTLNALRKIETRGKTIVDIGCGGGDMALTIYHWSETNNMEMKVFGLDLNPFCVDRSRKLRGNNKVIFVLYDYKNVFDVIPKVDIVHACLFTHHLGEAEIVALIKLCLKNKATLIINDLERNRLAYYSIKWITRYFSKSYLVKNDAPLSVTRGFKRKEWETMLNMAGVQSFSIRNRWAFRHQVIVYG